MAETVKTQLTINLQKKRDSWERKVRIAKAQAVSMRNNFNIYENHSSSILKAYKKWLKDHNIEPLMDLNNI